MKLHKILDTIYSLSTGTLDIVDSLWKCMYAKYLLTSINSQSTTVRTKAIDALNYFCCIVRLFLANRKKIEKTKSSRLSPYKDKINVQEQPLLQQSPALSNFCDITLCRVFCLLSSLRSRRFKIRPLCKVTVCI